MDNIIDCNCNISSMEEPTEQFLKRYKLTWDEVFLAFTSMRDLRWDPILSKHIPKFGSNDTDPHEMLVQCYEEEKERELRETRKELEKRFGPFKHETSTEVKKMIDEINALF